MTSSKETSFPGDLKIATVFKKHDYVGGRALGVVSAGGQEMRTFSTVFRDFGKNMVWKRYFQH